LTVGSAVRVGDLVLPPGVTTDVDPEVVVASGQAAKTEAAMAAAEGVTEGAPAEGGEETAAADGEAPAES
jgi:hypothetical protein